MPVQQGNTPASIERLVAPLPVAEFFLLLRARELTLRRGTSGSRYATWIGWEALKRLIDRGEYSRGRDDMRVSKESVTVPQGDWSRNGKVDAAKVEEYL